MGSIGSSSPHFGGLWEAAVKSANFHFYKVVGASILAIDELRTLAYEISAILSCLTLLLFAKAAIAGDPDATTFLEKVEQLVFVPTSREEQVARRNV